MQPAMAWPMLCITCYSGMCMGKCIRAHETSSGRTGLEVGRLWHLSMLIRRGIFTLCNSRVQTVMYFKRGSEVSNTCC